MRTSKLPENKYHAALRLQQDLKSSKPGMRSHGARKLLAEKYKISLPQVSNILSLLDLSYPVQRMLDEGVLRFSHGIAIKRAPKDRQEELAYAILSGLRRQDIQAFIDSGYRSDFKQSANDLPPDEAKMDPDTMRLMEHYENLYGVTFKVVELEPGLCSFTLIGYDPGLVNDLMLSKGIQFEGSVFTLDLSRDSSDGSVFRVAAELDRRQLKDHLTNILRGFDTLGKLRKLRDERSARRV